MSISDAQYIKWVQRSLNRIFGSGLKVDGVKTVVYQEQVKEFQFAYALPLTGFMAPADQNKLIKANHFTYEYVVWIQECLNAVKAGALVPDGLIGNKTRTSIKSFQAYQGLLDDGWVGAKTETSMIAEAGKRPPGEEEAGPKPLPVPPKPKPKPENPHDPLTPEQRFTKTVNSLYYEALYDRGRIYPNTSQRKKLLCFLHKLKQRGKFKMDFEYITGSDAYRYQNKTGYTEGVMPDEIVSNFEKGLRRRLNWMSFEDRTNQEKLRWHFLSEANAVDSGVNAIKDIHGRWGDASNSAKALARWLSKKQDDNRSLYSCYQSAGFWP
ncbi:peptidoglycan-binding protein [uncultured Roseibium sp.]|uniref:peptidoglycan-binding domain-containing protein n=1 Tax=uncultured Roseibium sp. TaxID=1936171 RepID=UPI00260D9EFE|nr:peptidoglycan-binding protein [uncultured Roseibium sp.]